jgi:hypothetical protein
MVYRCAFLVRFFGSTVDTILTPPSGLVSQRDTNFGERERLIEMQIWRCEMSKEIITSNERPVKGWTLKALEAYAQQRALEINNFGRKTLVQTWLFGSSLSLIKEIQKKDQKWMEWVKTQPYSLSTATNAVKLFQRVTFEELSSFDGMSVSDLKAALDIIKSPPPQRKKQSSTPPQQAKGTALKLVNGQEQAEPSADVEQSTNVTTTQPHVTGTDYRRNGRKTTKPVVGPTLTASEVLGQALNLLLEVEKQGVTADCSEILTEIAAKVASLLQAVNNVQTS